jgi:hypothetical protein
MAPIAGRNAGAAPRALDGDKLDASLWQGGYRIVEAGFETVAGAIGATVVANRGFRRRKD